VVRGPAGIEGPGVWPNATEAYAQTPNEIGPASISARNIFTFIFAYILMLLLIGVSS
jgi:hypothetical protein